MNSTNCQILLIEDSESDAILLADMLSAVTEFPHAIEHAPTVGEAREIMGKFAPDVILLDLNLPDSQGLDTYSVIRQAAATVPIIILTGNDDREMLASAMQSGADNYLIKGRADGGRVATAIMSSIIAKSRKAP